MSTRSENMTMAMTALVHFTELLYIEKGIDYAIFPSVNAFSET